MEVHVALFSQRHARSSSAQLAGQASDDTTRLLRRVNHNSSPGGGTADATDLKSVARKGVRVRLPPGALLFRGTVLVTQPIATAVTLHDLYRSLDERKRPEDVARIVLAVAQPSREATEALRAAAVYAGGYSSMSDNFHRSFASLNAQLNVAAALFAVARPADAADVEAVEQYLATVERGLGKTVGRNDYKHDRLNKQQ